MAAKAEEGQLAAKVLDEFMKSLQARNPYLKVFSAHLHMDEATPHLHVDFIPFTIGSKRGNERLHNMEKDYGRLCRHLGCEKANTIIDAMKKQELADKKPKIKRDYVR